MKLEEALVILEAPGKTALIRKVSGAQRMAELLGDTVDFMEQRLVAMDQDTRSLRTSARVLDLDPSLAKKVKVLADLLDREVTSFSKRNFKKITDLKNEIQRSS